MDLNNTPFFDTLGLSRGSLVNYRKVFFFFFRYFIFSSNTFAFRRNYDFLTTFDINIIIIVTSNFIEDLKLSKRIWILIIKFLFHLPYQRHTYERSLYFFFKEKQGELNFRLNSFFFLATTNEQQQFIVDGERGRYGGFETSVPKRNFIHRSFRPLNHKNCRVESPCALVKIESVDASCDTACTVPCIFPAIKGTKRRVERRLNATRSTILLPPRS